MITTGLFTFHDCDFTHWIDSFVLTMEFNQVESKKRRFDEARSEWGEINESPDTSGAYVMPARNSVEELSAVMDLKSRKGKWTRPEEDYANALIRHFDSGQVTDGIPGETLRKYLCKKLVCKQMRISKKYSGTLIGKHIYVHRQSDEGSDLEARRIASELDNLEKLFCKSMIAVYGKIRSDIDFGLPDFSSHNSVVTNHDLSIIAEATGIASEHVSFSDSLGCHQYEC